MAAVWERKMGTKRNNNNNNNNSNNNNKKKKKRENWQEEVDRGSSSRTAGAREVCGLMGKTSGCMLG